MKRKIIVMLRGGIGNQLFCYSFSRNLSLKNNYELVLDVESGFKYDSIYKRKPNLKHFYINARIANPSECFEPFGRARRKLASLLGNKRLLTRFQYIKEKQLAYSSEYLKPLTCKSIYLDGYWQSESYFKENEITIRRDLTIIPPSDLLNHHYAIQIQKTNSVCLHVRWFFTENLLIEYYKKALQTMKSLTSNPIFFLFSDHPEKAASLLQLSNEEIRIVDHNRGDDMAYADLWLMSQCKNFIIADSTFSWWGAWLSENKSKIVIAPRIKKNSEGAWGFDGLIPMDWILI